MLKSIFYPRWRDHPSGDPLRGPNLISFGLISSPKETFLILNYYLKSAFLDSKNILSPVAGATEMLPYGVPFESLSFLYPPPNSFFLLQIPYGESAFFLPAIFYIDGWDGWDEWDGMGWMGWGGMGWWTVGPLFFCCPYLEN